MKATYITHSGDDLLVVNAARVSFDKKSDWKDCTEDEGFVLREGDEGLLNFLARHGHWTPFAHPHITLHIRAPISIRTQCFKHKIGFIENEISRRYVDSDPEFFIPVWRKRAENKKQGSLDELPEDVDHCYAVYDTAMRGCAAIYRLLLKLGVAPEQARFVLPQGTYTEWYWTGSLASYARFYHLRTDPTAQKEVCELAEQIGNIIQPLYPNSWRALDESNSSWRERL